MSDKDIARLTDSVFTGKQIQNKSNNNLYFKELNQNQKKAVETLDGPLLVLSGAGTGKTRVLTARIANLLFSSKAKPWNILAVTFTNKAAKEMRERLENLIGPSVNNIWLGTFHSISVKFLRRHAEALGYKSNFTILDTDDQKKLVRNIVKGEDLDAKKFSPQLPSTDDVRKVELQVPLKIFTSDGKLIGEYGEIHRTKLNFDDIPDNLVKAFLAAEDSDFFSHSGVDFLSLVSL